MHIAVIGDLKHRGVTCLWLTDESFRTRVSQEDVMMDAADPGPCYARERLRLRSSTRKERGHGRTVCRSAELAFTYEKMHASIVVECSSRYVRCKVIFLNSGQYDALY